jgi:hypothetical protein
VVDQSLVELVRVLRAALVSFDPGVYSGEDCAALAEELAAVEKVSGVARVRAAARAGECGVHREGGFSDVHEWMARATGSTAGSAKTELETVAALESQPEAKAALEAGELSFAQARELIRTEAAVPGSIAWLLDVARNQSLRTLKEKARDRRVRAIDPEELHALQHAAMYHRSWITTLGNVAYAGELPPELGIPFINKLDAETDRLWLKAHQDAKQQQAAGQQELGGSATNFAANSTESSATAVEVRRSALAAQAFVRMMENGAGGGKRTGPIW